MSELRNIVKDVKSGALPPQDWLGFAWFLLRQSGCLLVVLMIVVVLLLVAR